MKPHYDKKKVLFDSFSYRERVVGCNGHRRGGHVVVGGEKHAAYLHELVSRATEQQLWRPGLPLSVRAV